VKRRQSMAETPPDDPPAAAAPGVTCRHLRANSMYLFDGGTGGTGDDDYEPSACWCLLTMKAFGPDDDIVSRRDCRNTGRSCYEPL
jgi:hypothetical protein